MEALGHWIGWLVLLILAMICSFWTLACSVFSNGNEGKFFLAGAALFWFLTIKVAPFAVIPT